MRFLNRRKRSTGSQRYRQRSSANTIDIRFHLWSGSCRTCRESIKTSIKRTKIVYTKTQFGKELKERVLLRQDVSKIGCWAYEMYLEHIEDIDDDFREVLITLNGMELGSEFAYSYERLNEIANDLIAGKENINLGY